MSVSLSVLSDSRRQEYPCYNNKKNSNMLDVNGIPLFGGNGDCAISL